MEADNAILVGRHREILEQLGDREPSTILEAQAVLEGIRAEKGYLDLDTLQDLASIRAQSRNNILRIIEQKKETEAAYTRSVSEQLYSSKYRCLYELIQNADDLTYVNASRNNKLSYLCFTITPQSLLVETNEDGFTRKNIEAICATGRSSKKVTATDEHIGEKGFGFKSVFAVADEVQIQSGLWSFRFVHRRGNSGLGMVTPLDAPFETLATFLTTRISLRLDETTQAGYGKLIEAIAGIPETTIFFLRRLKAIKFIITHPEGNLESILITKSVNASNDVVTIKRKRVWNGEEAVDQSKYYTFERTLFNMPIDDRRKDKQTVTIDLAFPVYPETWKPKLNQMGQHVFAYLPLQRLPQLQFLIQSDFIASASRESVVDCAWNDHICEGVAKAFTLAVQKFCTAEHHLRHSWLEFLPTKPMEQPWKRLYPQIKRHLASMSVLQTRGQRRFKRPSDLRWVPELGFHDGDPILEDLAGEIYLAQEYSRLNHDILIDLGVSIWTNEEIISRVQADLVNFQSRIKTLSPNNSWHEAFATLLSDILPGLNVSQRLRLKRLAIIPLSRSNQWTGAPGMGGGGLERIYFPYTGSTPIPDDIGLHLLDKVASGNATRKRFYKALGVEECPKEVVFAKIKVAHQLDWHSLDFRSHLMYFFQVRQWRGELKYWFRMPTDDGTTLAVSARFYFPSNNEYDMDQLLTVDVRRRLRSRINMLPRNLVELNPPRQHTGGFSYQSWKEWLEEISEGRRFPPLLRDAKDAPPVSSFGSTSPLSPLSPDLEAVLRFNPRKFLGTLKAHWNVYQDDVPRVLAELRNCEVPCRSGKSLPICTTYLPTVDILKILLDLGLANSDDGIPILILPDGDLDDVSVRHWRFLEDLGARSKPDLEFYKLALSKIGDNGTVARDRVNGLYASMARLATTDHQDALREFFNSGLYIRSARGWVSIRDCVWKGPAFLRHTTVLETHYNGEHLLENFFRNSLGVRNWTHSIILHDLSISSETNADASDLSYAREIYTYLDTHAQSDTEWREIREHFRQHRSLPDPDGIWHTLATCVWDPPFPLSGYQDLHSLYPDLEEFFTKRLKIKKVNLVMMIGEIKRMAEHPEPRIEEIRLRLIETGRIFAKSVVDSNVARALQNLEEVKFLPKRVTNNALILVGVRDEFTILDHPRYGKALASHGVMLHFTIEETQILHVLFRHLLLTRRYLSVAVAEESSVEGEVALDDELSRQFRDKAYALYCCAAKHKSPKAIPEERSLFDQLRETEIYTTDSVTTNLVLQLSAGPLKVLSDRIFLHHEVEERLKLYVPKDDQRRRACYRTQLPKLLTNIIGTQDAALHDISTIISSSITDLEDILVERDFHDISWIEKPVIELPERQDNEPPADGQAHSSVFGPGDHRNSDTETRRSVARRTPSNEQAQSSVVGPVDHPDPDTVTSSSAGWTPVNDRVHPSVAGPDDYPNSGTEIGRSVAGWTPAPSSQRSSRPSVAVGVEEIPNSWIEQYRSLLDQLIRSAQVTKNLNHRFILAGGRTEYFDTAATFGSRLRDEFSYNRRVGAAGEAFIFEYLSALNIPGFTYENWQSTIRGEVSVHPRYADLQEWRGRETADLVYTDRSGHLTQHLRTNCIGGFPGQIPEIHNFATHPIEYYLEVKTTTSACGTRFYLSNSQYKRMEDMAIGLFQQPNKLYVLLRVFDLVTPNVGLKLFVDPWKLRGSDLEFEAEQWFGRTL
ncbi:hypothetical protein BCR34DRAFT_596464 [Clohesyomyces aquaticus]|uniref:Protein NO VEIN C-terminal domain-containing protein n=1 Tax=Clohesyomyces aquaticus TaxID=1231657 RepID=A0A1Y2A6X8_9PLEO|nr:hypothetical protein BCR34DRAFT_596464 [Clohesyomyces aquaticus]